ncbi:MAG: response regulator [Acidimicrobiales bacterium]
MTEAIQVVIVDDQPLLRAGFAMILEPETDIALVGEATDGAEAIEVVGRLSPHVVLMDIRMPRVDGIEATRRITSSTDAPAVLILTTFDLDEYVFAALRAGASGFLLKDAPADDLVAAIRIVAGGDALLAPSVTKRLITSFAEMRIPTDTGDHAGIAQLTEREAEVLSHMARGLSNGEIAAELILGETTVKTHVGRILMKLGARDRVQAVIAAYEAGVVSPGA